MFADHHLWDAVLPHLDGLDVTALDGPGHGTSPRTRPLPSLDEQVDVLAGLLDRPTVLAGHSWGGMLALRVAVRRPELVTGLLLTNTPLLRDVRAPAVLVSGEQDYVRTAADAVAATGHEVHLHPGGHMGPAEAPEHVGGLLSRLAAQASAAPSP